MSKTLFYALLERHPRIAHLWDQETGDLHIALFKKELRVMSDGECDLALFFASVWLGGNRRVKALTGAAGFDFVDAMSRADTAARRTFTAWMTAPFWP